jgi:hypothetical protein
MRIIWTLFKVIIGLAIAIPLGLIVLALSFGILGAMLGLAILALKLACVGLVGYGAFRLAKAMFWPSKSVPTSQPASVRALPERDPYYEAAMRELDTEIGRN